MRLTLLCAVHCGKIDPETNRTSPVGKRFGDANLQNFPIPDPMEPHGIALALMSATIESDDGSDDDVPDRRVHLKLSGPGSGLFRFYLMKSANENLIGLPGAACKVQSAGPPFTIHM